MALNGARAALRDDLTRRLYLVRELLTDALRQVDDPLSIGRMRAVLAVDQAVELAAVTLLAELAVPTEKSRDLPKLLGDLCAKVPTLSGQRGGVERLRRLRDRVQHDGMVPSAEEVRQGFAYADGFVRSGVSMVLQRDLDEISPVALVANEKARSHLVAAENHLRARDYGDALKEAAVAFEIGWSEIRVAERLDRRTPVPLGERIVQGLEEAVKTAGSSLRSGQGEEVRTFASALARQFSMNGRLRDAIGDLTEPMELGRLGVDVTRHAQFVRIAPYIITTFGDAEPKVYMREGWAPNQADALFAFSFAIDALLQLQRAVGRGREGSAVAASAQEGT